MIFAINGGHFQVMFPTLVHAPDQMKSARYSYEAQYVLTL